MIDISKLKDVLTYNAQAPLIFSSGLFLWLFAAFIIIYYLLRKQQTGRLLFVVLFSYYFYYKSSGLYFWLLALVTICDYFIAKAIGSIGKSGAGKTLVALSLILDLGLLVFFKYTNFLGESICTLLTNWGIHVPSSISSSYLLGVTWQHRNIFLPVGISFFPFQSLTYT